MRTQVVVPPHERRERYATVEDAARAVGETKNDVRYLVGTLGLSLYKFQLDKRSYVKKEDIRKIKSLRQAARA